MKKRKIRKKARENEGERKRKPGPGFKLEISPLVNLCLSHLTMVYLGIFHEKLNYFLSPPWSPFSELKNTLTHVLSWVKPMLTSTFIEIHPSISLARHMVQTYRQHTER